MPNERRKGYANFDPLRMDDCYEPTELMRERAAKAKPLSAWEKVKAARRVGRCASVDYMENILKKISAAISGTVIMEDDTFYMLKRWKQSRLFSGGRRTA